jgi:hypothetical protein
MHHLVAQDEDGTVFVIGTFSTEARAAEWWGSWYGDGGPWKLLGPARQLSGREAEHRWCEAGYGLAQRSKTVRDRQ